MKQFLIAHLTPSSLWSWPVLIVTLTWSISTNLLDTVYNPAGHYPERLAAVVGSHAVMFGAMFFGLKPITKLGPFGQALVMIPFIVALSVVRGVTKWSMMISFGLDSIDIGAYRIFGPIANIGIPLLLTAIAVQKVRAYSNARAKILNENARLLELRELVYGQMRTDASRRLDEIRRVILTSLEREANSGDTAGAIRRTIESVVKPLSREIEHESFVAFDASDEVKAIRLDWIEALRDALSARFLNPVAVACSGVATSILFIAQSHPALEASYLLLVIGVGTWALLAALKWILAKIELVVPALTRQAMFIVGVIAVGFGVGLSTLPATLQSADPFAIFILAPWFIPGLAILFAVAGSTQAQAQLANERLADTTRLLAWEVTRVSEEHRQLRKGLANLLHGTLQSGLTSALMRLHLALRDSPETLSEVERSVTRELKSLITSAQLNDAPRDLHDALAAVQDTWDGLAEISVLFDGVSDDTIAADRVLLNSLGDLFIELTFNAVKHGNATRIEFVIERDGNTVRLTCADNGARPKDAGRIGLGTKLLDECALEWRRQFDAAGTTTALLLPFAPAASSGAALTRARV